MHCRRENAPLWFDDPDDFGRLREVLAGAEFTDEGVARRLGIDNARSLSSRDVPLLLRATREATPLDTLIRLFLIGVPVDADVLRRTILPMTLDTWFDAGLVFAEGESIVAAMQLLPFRGLVLAFDLPQQIQRGLRSDYVMGIGSSTLTLANLTVRRPAQATLDLGAGCGFLAMLAASHSAQVTAVDCNPRAVDLAAFNARLNDLPNVECLEGDLFEPVAGRRFDLVVSNPPFVISPESTYIYRDSGMARDLISRRIVRDVPGFLGEGAYCQILCNWAHLEGEDWREHLAGWFEGTGCDAWVMRSDTLEAPDYAAKWIRHTERDDPQQFDRRFQRWTDYYRRERIEAVSGGLITMRLRSAASHWFRADDAPAKMLGPAGDDVVRGFELHDFLDAATDDQQLLARQLRVSPDVRWQQAFEPSAEGWSISECRLELARGLAYTGNVDPYMARLVGQCDGQRRLGDLIGELSGWIERDRAEIQAACLEVVRRLVERGFLLP